MKKQKHTTITDPSRFDPNPGGITSKTFWDQRYSFMTTPPGGRPSAALARFAAQRQPGTALDLGCARGDDAIWLGRQGWIVTGVDVSQVAVAAAHEAAKAAGVAERTHFACYDLDETFPPGHFDLVSAMFLHSPVEFRRTDVLRRAANSVAVGGLFLAVSHGSRPPWSWAAKDKVFLSAEDELAALNLNPVDWNDVFVGSITRQAIGPDDQRAEVIDIVVAVERR